MSSSESSIESIGLSLRMFAVGSYLFQSRLTTELGLHPTDLQAVHLLSPREGLSAGELGRELGLTTGAVTALIDRLERMGYAERQRDPADRRRVMVVLKGGETTAALRQKYEEEEREVEKLLHKRDESELAAIASFLEDLVMLRER